MGQTRRVGILSRGTTAVLLLLANRQRVRAGIGYRRSFAWRFEARYVWNRSRNTIDEPFTSTEHAIDLTMKRMW